MPSPLGSFLLTLSTESQSGVDSGEATIQIFVSDNAKMMRMTSCASYSSSNDSDPAVVVAAINVARKVKTKRTNWDRLCSPISERRAVQQTLSLPRRKLSQDNIASMAPMQQRAARRSQSMSLTNKRNELLQRKVVRSEADKYASSTSTHNATFSIPQEGKINPFTNIFPTPCKEKDLSTRSLECPQRKPSVDNMMSSILKTRSSLGTPSNQGNASFDTESLKCHGKRALLNPFKTLIEPPTKQASIIKKTVNIEQIPMPISPLASKTNKLHLKSALKTCLTHTHKTKSVTILSLTGRLQKSHPESVNAIQAMIGFQQQEQHHQQDPYVRKNGKARRLGETVVTLQKCIDLHDRSTRYGPRRSLNGKAA
jgi:hypothetical protein